jgi:hypothetical protein
MSSPRLLKYVAFTLMALFGLLGGAFVIGETFTDPGGWTAVWVSALWVVPVLALSGFALLRPESAGPVFVVVTAVVALFTLADSIFGIIPRDDWGPVAAIVVFALGVALAFLGLRRALLAGTLMVTAAATQLVATVAGAAVHAAGDGPGPGAGLGGSSGVVVLPLLVVGALFVEAGRMEGDQLHWHWPPRTHPAH